MPASTLRPKVFIVILNWNNFPDTAECLRSLAKVRYPRCRVILVDNGSRDGSAEALEKEFPRVTLLRNPVNAGFAGGNNIGLEYSLKSGADYVLLLNNDTTVPPEFLDILVAFGQSRARAGILGPKVLYYDDPLRIWSMGGRFRWAKGSMDTLGHNQLDGERFEKNVEMDYVPGSSILIKREVLEEVGLLDTDYFFFAEESDFCLKARRKGFQVFAVPQARIWHKASRALGHTYSPVYVYFRSRNRLLLVYKNFSLPYFLYSLLFHVCVYMPYTAARILTTRRRTIRSLLFLGFGLADVLAYVLGRRFVFSRSVIS